jgi:hypothetical protein
MQLTQRTMRICGQAFWCALLLSALYGGYRLTDRHSSVSDRDGGDLSAVRRDADHRQALQQIVRFAAGRADRVQRLDPVGSLRSGDPIFLADSRGGYRQVGSVCESADSKGAIELTWYAPELSPDECQLFQHHATGKLSEVVRTLLPPEKQQLIRERIAAAMSAHGEEITRAMLPLVQQSLKRSLPTIEQEFRQSVARHRDEIDQAMARWNKEFTEEKLIPLARREILPIVKTHGQEPAEAIGREIWNRASLFRFGWRAIYDQAPLPQRNLVQQEWQRFVREEVVPVLESHMDEVVVAIQRSVRDITANEEIRAELAAIAEEIAADPESRRLVQTVLKETFVDNERLKAVWRDVWSSPEAKAAFEVAGDRLEPVVREIGDEIFGSREEGINPDFARVLRTQILQKDRRWIVAWHTGANNGQIEMAQKPMPYPIVYLAGNR